MFSLAAAFNGLVYRSVSTSFEGRFKPLQLNKFLLREKNKRVDINRTDVIYRSENFMMGILDPERTMRCLFNALLSSKLS